MAFTVLFIAAGIGVWRNASAINQIQVERHERIASQDAINCSLARLVNVSVQQPQHFGAGVKGLSRFDLRVLSTIAKVQAASSSTAQTVIFKVELSKLRRNTTCRIDITSAREKREQRR